MNRLMEIIVQIAGNLQNWKELIGTISFTKSETFCLLIIVGTLI